MARAGHGPGILAAPLAPPFDTLKYRGAADRTYVLLIISDYRNFLHLSIPRARHGLALWKIFYSASRRSSHIMHAVETALN